MRSEPLTKGGRSFEIGGIRLALRCIANLIVVCDNKNVKVRRFNHEVFRYNISR
jgi:hypothetical protein